MRGTPAALQIVTVCYGMDVSPFARFSQKHQSKSFVFAACIPCSVFIYIQIR